MYNHMKRAERSLVKISQKGWVVIPAQVRAKYHWKSGDRVKVVDYGGVVSLIPVVRRPEEDAMGALTQPGGSLTSGLKRLRREERRRGQGWKSRYGVGHVGNAGVSGRRTSRT